VAVLVPPPAAETPDVQAAVEEMRRFRKGRSLGGITVREMIEGEVARRHLLAVGREVGADVAAAARLIPVGPPAPCPHGSGEGTAVGFGNGVGIADVERGQRGFVETF
jgi:hypothetical protein